MITFELEQTKDSIEILVDSAGVEELINYLQFIKKKKESFHLLIGNELNDSLNGVNNSIIKHVKLIYFE